MENIFLSLKKRTFFYTLLATILMLASPGSAAQNLNLQQKLQRKVSVTWQGQQLAVALERLAGAEQITLWLDRRVDRQQTVAIECVDLPLVQALERVALQQSLGFTQLENLVYIGPQQSTEELDTLLAQAREPLTKLPATVRKRWLKKQPATWPRLSEPRALAIKWLEEAGFQILGDEKIPHDLWSEQSLPPLALVDRVVLLLVGFDLTCEIADDGKSCKIVPISRPLDLLPQRRRPRRRGPPRRRPLAQPANSPPAPARQLLTLRLENQPLGRVLDHFAKQLQLEVTWELEDKERSRAQRVSCDVQKVGLDMLLQNVLSPAGLRHQRDGKQVTIEVGDYP